jgi:hypothetical protein
MPSHHERQPDQAVEPPTWSYFRDGFENASPVKTRGHFPDEQSATKLIYLAILRAEGKWQQAYNWTGALRGLKIHFGDRLPD